MFNKYNVRKPNKRTALTLVFILVFSYGAFLVGDSITHAPGIGVEGDELQAIWDSTGYKATRDTVKSDDATYAVNAVAAASSAAQAAQAAEAASGRVSPLSVLFNVAATGIGGDEVDEFESASAGRMVVYTAHIGLKVKDVNVALDEIKLISDLHGGYVSSVNTRDERGSVTLRVPERRFHEAISDLEALGEVTVRDLMGDDVTEEYVDLEAQLVTLQHQESRLFEIMEMGTTVDSVLKVERELERVRGRIESIQGRIQYLDNRVDLSTITVSLLEEVEEVEVIQAWFPRVDWAVPVRTGLMVLVTVMQGMLTMGIILGPFIALGYGGVKLFRWYREGKVSPSVDTESG